MEHTKVFLHGIPGIGKSELAKAYAKQHAKDYTNVIYINYLGDLKQTIIDLDFADDLPNEDREAKFKRHNRFLRSLREDTLIIVDNFNAVEAQDPLLDVIMKYRCRILFTTRSRYDNQTAMEVVELKPDTLCELIIRFFPKGEKRKELLHNFINLLHRHTFAVELSARLLSKGILSPKGLLAKLEKEKKEIKGQILSIVQKMHNTEKEDANRCYAAAHFGTSIRTLPRLKTTGDVSNIF
jgi:chromosomal replication initiation ATPase DnaA